MRVLLIEDEPTTATSIELMLATEGFNVYTTDLGEEGLDLGKLYDYDIILLDLNLPDMRGYDVLKKLRVAKVSTSVLILSGISEMDSKVRALGFGADDYVTKPFGMSELLARVRANLRRVPAAQADGGIVIEEGDFRIDVGAHTVAIRGKEVRLTPKEFELLVYLGQHAGKVVTHRALLAAVWGPNATEQPEYLRVFIGQLRKKIEPDPSIPKYIQTEPWVGYRFTPGGVAVRPVLVP